MCIRDSNSTIRTAVAAWLADATAAQATYGHISTWATGGVTDMAYLFCGIDCFCRDRLDLYPDCWCGDCNTAAASFNEDIGAWDTSGVMSMGYMFHDASAFNQDISGWAVHSVTDMYFMFTYASAFNQDLGWCVDDGVDLSYALSGTQCESTSCGIGNMALLRCGSSMGDSRFEPPSPLGSRTRRPPRRRTATSRRG